MMGQGYLDDEDHNNLDGYDSEEEFIDDTQFEDPEGFIDEVSEEDLVGDLLEQRPKESDSLDTVIIVDNIPVVGDQKLAKLKTIIRKVFSKFGNVVNEFYPEENGETKGFIFLEYSNASDAQHAVKAANGYKLDKNHTFNVNSFSDFDKYKDVTDEWVPPEPKPYEDRGNLQSWLLDPECQDQYSVIHSESENNVSYSAILQNGPTAPNLISKRCNWTDSFMSWSPKGTYLATLHRQGVCIWGGKDFGRLNRFNHTSAQLIDWSPCERYIITYSPEADNNPQDPNAIAIFDIRSGAKKRGFHAGTAKQWPVFKWSHDGKHFARQHEESLFIYETPGFGLMDKKSIRIPDLKDFSWSPKSNYLVYWVPEIEDIPARVVVLDIPSRREVRVKNLFHVADCKMHWQVNGDYLCVKVERFTKSKKGVYYNLELFRMKEKEIPVDTLEIKDPVSAVEWEPNGSKFCVIHGETPRICASFYEVQETQQRKVTLLKTLEKRTVNTICWAPLGQFVVLAGLRSMNGVLEFVDTSDMTVMATEEHYMATDIEWDPSGRYFMSGVSFWSQRVDNGYFIWSFQGKILQRHPLKEFCSFQWRPRPKTLLSEEEKNNIKKDMKRYQKMFEAKDKMIMTKASKELIDKRRKMYNEFASMRTGHTRIYDMMKQIRLQLRGGVDTDNLCDEEINEETFEFFVKEETQIIEGPIPVDE